MRLVRMVPGSARNWIAVKKSTIQPQQKMKAKQAIMKTTIRTLWNSLLIVFLGTLLAGQARGQIFVTTQQNSGTIGEYDYNNGGTVNASLVSGFSNSYGIAVSGANLFVTNSVSGGTIG